MRTQTNNDSLDALIGDSRRIVSFEANPPKLGGSAAGVINFINFTFSALLGPVFGARLVQMPEGDNELALAHDQAGFKPLLYGVLLALILTAFLKETGPKAQKT